MKWLHLTAAVMLLAACVSDRIADDSLDEIAADYVQMTLEIGEREPGYVDAYYGQPEWRDADKAVPRSGGRGGGRWRGRARWTRTGTAYRCRRRGREVSSLDCGLDSSRRLRVRPDRR